MDTHLNVRESLPAALAALTQSQLEWVLAVVEQFQRPITFTGNEKSDLVTVGVLELLGGALRIHHAFSRQALSKDRFEYALERSLNRAGMRSELVANRTNPGHDITIMGVSVSLKTQADAGIRRDWLHIGKFMELGKGPWELPLLRDQFLKHLECHDRILQFRSLLPGPTSHEYELVEVAKSLLLEGAHAELVTQTRSRQTPQPGYGNVFDDQGRLKFALYFVGGAERKLQVKKIRRDLHIVHATWRFESTPFEQSIPS